MWENSNHLQREKQSRKYTTTTTTTTTLSQLLSPHSDPMRLPDKLRFDFGGPSEFLDESFREKFRGGNVVLLAPSEPIRIASSVQRMRKEGKDERDSRIEIIHLGSTQTNLLPLILIQQRDLLHLNPLVDLLNRLNNLDITQIR